MPAGAENLPAVRKREVLFSPEAAVDVTGIYDFIAAQSGPARARAYIDRFEKYCGGFALVGERGTLRDDIRPGLRTVGFERRMTIAFHVESKRVVIDRVLYAGRDIRAALPSRPR